MHAPNRATEQIKIDTQTHTHAESRVLEASTKSRFQFSMSIKSIILFSFVINSNTFVMSIGARRT